jgi:hypothetical protein
VYINIEVTQAMDLPLLVPVREKTIKLLKNGLIALIAFLLTLKQHKQKKEQYFSKLDQCTDRES